MAISISDLLKIPCFEPVTVEAGRQGLSRHITSATILDYEYAKDYTMKEQVFIKGDLVVSSLLFAKEDPGALFHALQELIELGAAGLAYKTVFFDALPPEVLALAEEHQFPILRFGMDLFMEDFLFRVMDSIRLERQMEDKEAVLEQLIEGQTPKSELRRTAKYIDPYLDRYGCAVYIDFREKLEFRCFERLYRGPTGVKHIDESTTVCRYHNGFFLILSDVHTEEKRYRARIQDVLAYLDLKPDGCWIGSSKMLDCTEELDLLVQQAYFSSLCAQVKRQPSQEYGSMGVYQTLIPYRHSPHMLYFMKHYLAPIQADGNDSSDELLHTAVEFVLSDGDIDRTAERVYCHKNTVRYRIKKLHEKLSPASSDLSFYEQLSTAVKIYLLNCL